MDIKGKLNPVDLSKILKTFYENKETGFLVITNLENKVEKSFYFREGDLCWVSSSRKIPLERIILGFKKISEEKIKEIKEIQSKTNKSMEEILMQQKIFSQNEFVEVLKRQLLEEVYDVYTWGKGVYAFKKEYLDDSFLKKTEKIQFSADINVLVSRGIMWHKKAEILKKNIVAEKSLIFTMKEELKSQRGLLFDKEKEVISLIDGKTKKDEIVKKTGFSESDVSEILYVFALKGVIFIKTDMNKYIFFI
ncbi:DUF4388 domain-containing protein [bacterium]|nr:DUF4388 domain-containing protein [bacterium]